MKRPLERKRLWLTLCLAAMLLSLAGCATAQEPMPSASPMTTASPSTAPEPTGDQLMPGTELPGEMNDANGTTAPSAGTMPAAQGVTSVSAARKASEEIEDELERLSEVTDAQVVLAGKNAAVALRFDSQYQAGIDDRMREIVKDRIDGIVSGIEKVAVTDSADIFDELNTLGDRLEGAADMTEIQNQLNAIINRIEAVSGKGA